MKVEYINCFYKAVQDVFKLMLDLEIERKDLKIVEDVVEGKDANIILGITGDLKGSIYFSFTKDMSLEMVKMMSGMEMEEIDMFVSSALGEVVNITGGNALIDLNKYDYTCDITTPQVILGHYQSVPILNDKAVVIPMKTEIGDFDVTISLSGE